MSVLRLSLAYLLLLVTVNSSADSVCGSPTTLAFGMVPITSANLTEVWAGRINRQVQRSGCYKLSFSSAADFEQYIDKAKNKAFDVLAVPAHIASYLIETAGFIPVVFLVWESRYLYVVPNASSIASIDQIDGRSLALPEPLAEASILARADMAAAQLDINYQYYKNFNQIFDALLEGRVDAGVVLSPFYNGYKKRTDIKIRPVHSAAFPSHGMLLAAPQLSEADRVGLFNTLAALEPNSDLFWQSFEPAPQHKIEALHLSQKRSVTTLKSLLEKH